jgi:hypothetical protein
MCNGPVFFLNLTIQKTYSAHFSFTGSVDNAGAATYLMVSILSFQGFHQEPFSFSDILHFSSHEFVRLFIPLCSLFLPLYS